MRVKIETVTEGQPEEVVIYCRSITTEIEAMARHVQELGRAKPSIAFFKGDEQHYLSLRELLFFETDSERVFAHLADESFEVKLRLYEVEELLPGYFVRISRSTLVNALQIKSIQKGLTGVSQIAFRNSRKEVYGSRMYYPILTQKMEERHLYEII
ncbi:MAG: LytTR family DNA-binding domain-containing protein [Eubacteriales bacterium]|nr:LytTR family DNA-binding domain-containing protein [Eubacteriales bacterium]